MTGGESSWNQTTLVVLSDRREGESKTCGFTDLSNAVDTGARLLETTGTCDDTPAFLNPNGTTVARNELSHAQLIQVQVSDRVVAIELPPDSVGTLAARPM